MSERRACRVVGQCRATQQYVPTQTDDEDRLRTRIIALAHEYGRYGYRRITALLHQEGWRVNHKRVERIWRQEGLKVPQKQPKRGRLWLAEVPVSDGGPSLGAKTLSHAGVNAGAWRGYGGVGRLPELFLMLLTIKDLAEKLQIKTATLYAWVAQRKLPSRKIHGLVRFDPNEIDQWLASFVTPPPSPPRTSRKRAGRPGVDQLVARAKREVYTSAHGETRLRSSLIGKEECDGAREAE